MDKITPAERSANMRQITSKGSAPERAVRSLVHKLGYRYRLHRADLPGKPDIVLPRLRSVIFVHGCFWHQHAACREGRIPASRPEYWVPKLSKNVSRDKERLSELQELGWRSLVIWECEVGTPAAARKIEGFLHSGKTLLG